LDELGPPLKDETKPDERVAARLHELAKLLASFDVLEMLSKVLPPRRVASRARLAKLALFGPIAGEKRIR
jgi:hypothetical protein